MVVKGKGKCSRVRRKGRRGGYVGKLIYQSVVVVIFFEFLKILLIIFIGFLYFIHMLYIYLHT